MRLTSWQKREFAIKADAYRNMVIIEKLLTMRPEDEVSKLIREALDRLRVTVSETAGTQNMRESK